MCQLELLLFTLRWHCHWQDIVVQELILLTVTICRCILNALTVLVVTIYKHTKLSLLIHLVPFFSSFFLNKYFCMYFSFWLDFFLMCQSNCYLPWGDTLSLTGHCSAGTNSTYSYDLQMHIECVDCACSHSLQTYNGSLISQLVTICKYTLVR